MNTPIVIGSSNNLGQALCQVFRFAAWACFAKLFVIAATLVVSVIWGERPSGALEFYNLLAQGILPALLANEILLTLLLFLYFFSFAGMLLALFRQFPFWSVVATFFTVIAIIFFLANDSSFSLLYLGKHYHAAVSVIERQQIIIAGEAIIAANNWNTTAAYYSGLMLQGSGIVISLLMFKSFGFSKLTAVTGLIANSLDLFQHIVKPFYPDIPMFFLVIAGMSYVVWFPLLGKDFLKISLKYNTNSEAA